ncbi:MAG: HIT domain-containing protein [Candidatus Kariarchaeaceae archaeon]
MCDGIAKGENPFDSPQIIDTDTIVGYVNSQHAASEGHCVFLPKKHAEKMHEVDNEVLFEIIATIKKVAKALDLENYNILQNNGALAFQTLFHVHFHLIPKNSENDGLRYLRDKGTFVEIDQSVIADKIIHGLNDKPV